MSEREPQGGNIFDTRVGQILRGSRKDGGQSLRVFARHIGVSEKYISNVERGKEPPSPQLVDLYFEEFHISPSTLYLISRTMCTELGVSGKLDKLSDENNNILKKIGKLSTDIDALKKHGQIVDK